MNRTNDTSDFESNGIEGSILLNESLNPPLVKPIRILQFILVSIFFGLTIYTVSKDSPYGVMEGTALTALCGSFFFIILIDIISQCGGDPIPDTPMFLFCLLGTLLFLLATGGIFFVAKKDEARDIWKVIVSAGLSSTCAFLFFLDGLLIVLYGY